MSEMNYYTTLEIHEVLEQFVKLKTRDEKVKHLQKNKSPALTDLIRCSLDPRIIFQIPVGSPPYTKASPESVPNTLLKQNKMLTFWVKGGDGDRGKVPSYKREKIFLDVLESIHPKDAEVLILAKEKKPLCKGLTHTLVRKAYPGLLPD